MTAVLDALTALRDVGLVVDRDHLNHAWRELTGRAARLTPMLSVSTPTTSGDRCQRPGCEAIGIPFHEPAGTWCADHRPVLWRQPDNPWMTTRCHACDAPGGWPNTRGHARPACRDHAPRSMSKYLMTISEEVPA